MITNECALILDSLADNMSKIVLNKWHIKFYIHLPQNSNLDIIILHMSFNLKPSIFS